LRDTGIINKDVYPSEGIHHVLHTAGNLFWVGYVTLEKEHSTTKIFYRFRCFFGGSAIIAVTDGDVAAMAGKQERYFSTDTAASTRNNRNLTG